MAEAHRRARVVSRIRPRIAQRLGSDERLVSLVRRGDRTAFEALYDRHVASLLSYCFFMLGSREDAEDAVQSTFASAYRALLRDERRVEVRPWLFAIARNACIGTLRKRRPQEREQITRVASEDLLAKVERRESVRELLRGIFELPEHHRTALLLAELHGHSQREIGRLLGVPPNTVKSYVFQARAKLVSERAARETACQEIREELATARGAALLRGRLRRHLRSCADCRDCAHLMAGRRGELRALLPLLPLLPTLALKRRVLDATAGQAAVGTGACVGGAGIAASGALELGGAGAKTLLAKVIIGVSGLAAGGAAGTLAVRTSTSAVTHAPHAARAVELAWDRSSARFGPPLDAGAPATAAVPGSTSPAIGRSAAGQGSANAGRVGSGARAAVAESKGAGSAGKGSAGDKGSSGSGKGSGQGNGGGQNGKAKGHTEERGNSTAAHAGSNGRGKSAEHGHAPGEADSAKLGSSGNHGSAANGSAARGKALGRGQIEGSGGAATNGKSTVSGGSSSASGGSGQEVNGNPHAAHGPPSASGQGGGAVVGAAGPSYEPAPVEEAPKGPPAKEASASLGASAEHGSQGGAAHESPGRAKG